MTLRYDTRSRVSTYTQSWVTNADPDFGVFESIATSVVGSGGASTITFSNIPQTYKHLQLRLISRNTNTANDFAAMVIRFNSDSTAANYFGRHIIYGDGVGAYSVQNNGGAYTGQGILFTVSGSSFANMFAVGVVDILDYANTNKNKTGRSLFGGDVNGSTGYLGFGSSVWLNSSAITSIDVVPLSNNHAQYSHFALYGIKG